MNPLPVISTLPNGLIVAVEENPAVQSVSFVCLVPRGCASDPAGQCGRTALLAEMMLRGAGERDSRALTDALDSLGLDRSVDHSSESMTVTVSCLAQHVGPALALVRDLLTRPRLDEDELELAKELCIQPILAIEDSPSDKLMVELNRRFLPPPFNRPAKGEIEEIRQLGVADLRRVTDTFSARGMILAFAGKITPAEARALAENAFGDFAGERAYDETAYGATRSVDEHLVKESYAQVQIGMARPSLPMQHPDYPKLQILTTILSGGMSSRLFVEVREKRGLVYGVRAQYQSLRRHGNLIVHASTRPERVNETVSVLRAEFARLGRGVTPEELERAKVQLRSSVVMSLDSPRHRAVMMAMDLFRLDRVRAADEILDAILGVGLARMNAFLAASDFSGFSILTIGKDGSRS